MGIETRKLVDLLYRMCRERAHLFEARLALRSLTAEGPTYKELDMWLNGLSVNEYFIEAVRRGLFWPQLSEWVESEIKKADPQPGSAVWGNISSLLSKQADKVGYNWQQKHLVESLYWKLRVNVIQQRWANGWGYEFYRAGTDIQFEPYPLAERDMSYRMRLNRAVEMWYEMVSVMTRSYGRSKEQPSQRSAVHFPSADDVTRHIDEAATPASTHMMQANYFNVYTFGKGVSEFEFKPYVYENRTVEVPGFYQHSHKDRTKHRTANTVCLRDDYYKRIFKPGHWKCTDRSGKKDWIVLDICGATVNQHETLGEYPCVLAMVLIKHRNTFSIDVKHRWLRQAVCEIDDKPYLYDTAPASSGSAMNVPFQMEKNWFTDHEGIIRPLLKEGVVRPLSKGGK